MDHGQAGLPPTDSEPAAGEPPLAPAPAAPVPVVPEPPAPAPVVPEPLPGAATSREAGTAKPPGRVGPTRLSGAWTAAVVAIVLVVAMLIFILQNEREVPISFVSAHGHLPLGVAMLFSAVVGAAIVVVCGTARILQLRRLARRRARAAAHPLVAAPPHD